MRPAGSASCKRRSSCPPPLWRRCRRARRAAWTRRVMPRASASPCGCGPSCRRSWPPRRAAARPPLPWRRDLAASAALRKAGWGRGLPGWASRGRAFAAAAALGGRRRLRQSIRPCGCRLLRRSPKSFCGAANGTQRHPPCASLFQPSFPRCSTQLPAVLPLLQAVVFLVHCRRTNLTPCLLSTPRRPAALSPESWTLGMFYCPFRCSCSLHRAAALPAAAEACL